MPDGVFDLFQGIDNIPVADLARWLKFKVEPDYLKNYLANRVIYPQTVPMNRSELEIDLAILREAILRDPQKIFNSQKGAIVLSEKFLENFPAQNLIMILIDSLPLPEKTIIFKKTEEGVEPLGTILNWRSSQEKRFDLMLQTGNETTPPEKMTVSKGELKIIDCSLKGAILRVNASRLIEIAGGKFGVVVDARGEVKP